MSKNQVPMKNISVYLATKPIIVLFHLILMLTLSGHVHTAEFSE